MPATDASTLARDAIDDFIRHLGEREFAASTRRLRRHFLLECLRHAQQGAGDGADDMTAGELMDPARADAWLADAAAGKTRTRDARRTRPVPAGANSMRARADSWNAFAEFLGLPHRVDGARPAAGQALDPGRAERLLHDLAVTRPVHASAVTSVRTAAVAALVADTGLGVPELAGLSVSALHLDGAQARADIGGQSRPLRPSTAHVLQRWLAARTAIIDALDGSDPGHLWIPTKPGRPRGGQAPVKPGIEPAAVRTLHAAHRALVSQLLGEPVRPGALRETLDAPGPARAPQEQDA